ncbi:MAG TPA: valine--tRNA ligase [Fimbriimonadaceae bacterium]|mgnify:CR=1 FL=1|nr:valine--tRNA ligase [Fimbriimonadaceae bacterium]HRJ97459.1 valine--tRNA ligase [Fimbriimonadaceae bacterium]
MADTTLSSRYDASQVETGWYERWERAGLFQPDPDPSKPRFTITIPPPNITGSLHMGHALCYPIQDLFGRYQRLLGKSVLVLPGQDHAGIATQKVVTQKLKAEGIRASEIGREKFVEHVLEWREESGGTISRQLRSLGCAFDWSRERYTLDPAYAEAVLKVFIDWFERGIIYRGKRVVNWDPVLKTNVSDIETERRDTVGKFYHIRYPFADGSGYVVIATTRPETMLADVAVAVHPSDKRYDGLVGKTLILPLMNREIPLITDTYPDPEKGTGAVKITPAHDANDYEVGVRHGLGMPVVMDDSARINELGGPYAGLDRYAARKKIVEDLEAGGFLDHVEDKEIALIISERSGEVIEPLLSEQWFARMSELAEPAIRAVQERETNFFPERYERIYMEWMENIRDWNISRQLWWGHRIPVYYTADGEAFAALSWDEAQAKAGAKAIARQDDDVLDTWFSSGLWPFATLGWPAETDDLKERYPTDVLITDRNILYLWVARMMMMGLDFMKEVPFHDVFIYATVLNEKGQRMSKSLGTGIDPMEVIERIGGDAIRYTLLSQAGANQDIRYSERKTEEARNFCNKIWNASRFVMMNVDSPIDISNDPPNELAIVDRWLLSRLHHLDNAVRDSLDGYDIQPAAQALYEFFWSELCDWYIEVSKSRLQDPATKAVPQWVLLRSIASFLAMMHPIMPHITEEIYSHLPIQDKAEFLMASRWPEVPPSFRDEESERRVERWFEITRALRALRAEAGLAAMRSVPVAYAEGDLDGGEWVIASQAWVEAFTIGKPNGQCLSAMVQGVELFLPIEGLIDLDKERERLTKEIDKLSAELNKVKAQLDNPMFRERAKPEAVEKLTDNAADLTERLAKAEERLTAFGSA